MNAKIANTVYTFNTYTTNAEDSFNGFGLKNTCSKLKRIFYKILTERGF